MSAPSTVEEVRKWLASPRRHRCVICDGAPVKRASATREGSGYHVTVMCHGEVTSAIIRDSYVEAQPMSGVVRWFENSATRDQLSKIDRHGRVASNGGDALRDRTSNEK